MDNKKQSDFVRRMGRKKYAKGGRVMRKRYDDGGTVLGGPSQTTSPGNTTQGNNLNPLSSVTGGPNSQDSQLLNSVTNPLANIANITQSQFQPTAANLQAGTNANQLNQAYTTAQGGLTAQQNLLNALSAQGGIANQSNVYNQLQGIANGTGPNPALAQLAQTTGQNVAAQGALMAGQRGAASNVGLIARQAAQQGAATQQQAVGQGATLAAQQELNAINSSGNIANEQVQQQGQATSGLNTAAQNEQNILQGANSNLNTANVSSQSNLNNVSGQIAQGNQQATNSLIGGALGGLSGSSILAKGGLVGKDGRKVIAVTIHPNGEIHHYEGGGMVDFQNGGYSSIISAGAPNIGSMASTNEAIQMGSGKQSGSGNAAKKAQGYFQQNQQNPDYNQPSGGYDVLQQSGNLGQGPTAPGSDSGIGSFTSGVSDAAGPAYDEGGEVDLGDAGYTPTDSVSAPNIGSMASTNEAIQTGKSGGSSGSSGIAGIASLAALFAKGGNICKGPHKSHVANYMMKKGGAVPAMVSPGEIYLSPNKVRDVMENGANPLKVGQKIPGKAKVKGDSLKNDTQPMTLEAGGVVLPRHIVKKMSPEKAELFVHRAMARKQAKTE